jgi:trigger factor
MGVQVPPPAPSFSLKIYRLQTMNIQTLNNEGLSHSYKITISQAEIQKSIDSELLKLSKKVKLPGFRPGKIPLDLLRQRYKDSVLNDALESLVDQTNKKLFSDKNLRPALKPKITASETYDDHKDFVYDLSFDALPEIKEIDVSTLSVEKWSVNISDEDFQNHVNEFLSHKKEPSPLLEDRPSMKGDVVTIDFDGSTEVGPIQGGKGEKYKLALGSNSFIPGFEDQIVGMKKGEDRTITVSFPEEYHEKSLAGQPAQFKIHLHDIEVLKSPELTDEWAQSKGLENAERIRQLLKVELEKENKDKSFLLSKKSILDQLAEKYAIDVPKSLVDLEFETIWKHHEKEHARAHEEGKDHACGQDEDLKPEFEKLAVRRVQLGLILAEIGRKEEVFVSQKETERALMEELSQYPQEMRKNVAKIYQENPQALATLRAPIFEDKVISIILSKSQLTEKTVTQQELNDGVKSLLEENES